jgi:hypothetical protein
MHNAVRRVRGPALAKVQVTTGALADFEALLGVAKLNYLA